jgi:ribosomal protein S18 acetylase RimI-like enzyme
VSPAGPNIRSATNADVDALLDLWQRAAATPSVTQTPRDVGRVIDAPSATVLVAVGDDGALVGSLIATFDGWRGHLYRLVVDPELRRRGLARRLFAEAETWLRAEGAQKLNALVEVDREIAQAFWESVGFEYEAGIRRYSKHL